VSSHLGIASRRRLRSAREWFARIAGSL